MPKTILITDNSAMIRRIVGQILQELGYRVIMAENGEKGVALALAEKPDLVIMDIEMPVLDGISATSRIKSSPETAAIPVLIFTSLGSEDDLKRARNAGCNGFLNKPVCKDELHDAVNAALGIKG